jgi:hypothetical protein
LPYPLCSSFLESSWHLGNGPNSIASNCLHSLRVRTGPSFVFRRVKFASIIFLVVYTDTHTGTISPPIILTVFISGLFLS